MTILDWWFNRQNYFDGFNEWIEIFVWYPVKLKNGKWIWFSKCYRRKIWVYSGFVDEPFYEFGTLFDVIQNSD